MEEREVPRTRKRKREYLKQTFVDALRGPEKAGAETLLEGVLDLYPKADQGRLEGWLKEIATNGAAERDGVLFFALICGTRFRVYSPDVGKVLGRLWQWLTWAPRHMDRDLAGLLVDALAPALEREFATRDGKRVGPGASADRLVGHPPTSRGAFVSAMTIDRYLRRTGLQAGDATERSLELAAILIGRDLATPEELRRTHSVLGRPDIGQLAEALVAQFEWWAEHDSMPLGSVAPEPPKNEEWRRQHTPLSNVLKRIGSRGLAEQVVARVPRWLWGKRVIAEARRRAPASSSTQGGS